MIKFLVYQSSDGRTFQTEEACLNHEKMQAEWQRRMNELIECPQVELEMLIDDLKRAKDQAYNHEIIDTMGTPQARAVFYMKGVCQRFVDKHKDLKMI
jgi:hypothetical protein